MIKKQAKLMLGDNMESLKKLPDNSIDSIVTDPPYALTSIKKRFGKEGSAPAQFGTDGAFQRASKGFMGKEWDAEVPTVEFWREVYRVLKPGGHILSFGGTRTYHRMVVNIEDAGFEIRDQVMWLYGSGFPKSHNIGKAVDKIEGNEREVVGEYIAPDGKVRKGVNKDIMPNATEWDNEDRIQTKGQSKYEGWGTALKPANEPICVARKPLSEKTIAENVIKWGTGGINIDGCRVGSESIKVAGHPYEGFNKETKDIEGQLRNMENNDDEYREGRFPANIILDESAAELLDEQSGISKSSCKSGIVEGKEAGQMYHRHEQPSNNYKQKIMVGDYNDKGGASRFFYVAKVSKKERNLGLDGFEEKETTTQFVQDSNEGRNMSAKYQALRPARKNTHPTLKPINLMTYLCRLITPEGGIVLDPFMGSGSTGISALLEGFRFVGMEMDKDYFKIAEARIEAYEEYRKLIK